jgi:serine/threonine protein kinase
MNFISELGALLSFIYFFLFRIKGTQLFVKICEHSTYNEGLVRHYMLQLMAALVYLHTQRVVHMDIKVCDADILPLNMRFTIIFCLQPENLLVEPNNTGLGRLRLVDLGDAKTVQEDNVAPEANKISIRSESNSEPIYENTRHFGLPPSTIEFCAPELLLLKEGEQDVAQPGPPSDMWSAGALLYAFLSGVSAFLDDSPEETAAHIVATDFCFPPEFWAGVSERARSLINKLLIGSPQLRATAQQCLNDAWLQQVSATFPSRDRYNKGSRKRGGVV